MAQTPDDSAARWRKQAAGRLSPAEHDALREEAMKRDEGRALYELYRPFEATGRGHHVR